MIKIDHKNLTLIKIAFSWQSISLKYLVPAQSCEVESEFSEQPHACVLFGYVAAGFTCFINAVKIMMVRKTFPVKLKIERGYNTHNRVARKRSMYPFIL